MFRLLSIPAISAALSLFLLLLVSVQSEYASGAFQRFRSFNYLFPDMVVTEPTPFYVVRDGDKKILRFSTTYANIGEGPLEIVSTLNDDGETSHAIQRITKKDGSIEEHDVGNFIFHTEHDHWHIEDYVKFEIWSVNKDGKPDKPLANTAKISMCLWDERPYNLSIENAASGRVYSGCKSNIQGTSIGWSDNYWPELPGQFVDITDLQDGDYFMISNVNFDHKILEKDYSNNENILPIKIDGFTVTQRNNN